MKALRLPFAIALAALALVVPAAASAAPGDVRVQVESRDTTLLDGGGGATARASAQRSLTPCTWSYFGDPRSIAYRDWIFTGCISPDGRVKLDEYNLGTGQKRLLTLFRGLESDDHNNPSLVFFKKKLYAFASEHSGYVYPLDRNPRMQYRVSTRDWGARRPRLGRDAHDPRSTPDAGSATPTRTPSCRAESGCTCSCGVRAGTRTTRRRRTGRRGRRRGRSCSARPPRAATCGRTRSTTRRRNGSILMTFSDGHPGSYKNSLYYMRYKSGRFYKADGTVIGTTRNLPFRLQPARPRAAVLGVEGAAVADGHRVRLRRRPVDRLLQPGRRRRRVPLRPLEREAVGDAADQRLAGGNLFGYRNGGITFNHADPSWVVLTRFIDGAARGGGPPHPGPGRDVEGVPAHPQLAAAELPPGVPARDHGPEPAGGRVRVGLRVELP